MAPREWRELILLWGRSDERLGKSRVKTEVLQPRKMAQRKKRSADVALSLFCRPGYGSLNREYPMTPLGELPPHRRTQVAWYTARTSGSR